MRDREAIYDEKLAPLVAQVIAVCKEHDIPFFFSAQLTSGLDEDGNPGESTPLFCTSAHLPVWASDRLRTCYNVLLHGVVVAWLADMKKAGLAAVPTLEGVGG